MSIKYLPCIDTQYNLFFDNDGNEFEVGSNEFYDYLEQPHCKGFGYGDEEFSCRIQSFYPAKSPNKHWRMEKRIDRKLYKVHLGASKNITLALLKDGLNELRTGQKKVPQLSEAEKTCLEVFSRKH